MSKKKEILETLRIDLRTAWENDSNEDIINARLRALETALIDLLSTED